MLKFSLPIFLRTDFNTRFFRNKEVIHNNSFYKHKDANNSKLNISASENTFSLIKTVNSHQ